MGRSNKNSLVGKVFILVFALVISLITLNSYWHNFLPDRQYIKVGDKIVNGMELPGLILDNSSLNLYSDGDIFSVKGNQYREFTFRPSDAMPVAIEPGELEMQVKLFGLLPIHRMMVNVVVPEKVIPGGQSVGILLHTEGVLVVGEAGVNYNGDKIFPARKAGIGVGDVIMRVNNKKVTSEAQLQEAIDYCGRQGKDVNLLVKHGKKTRMASITPILCKKTGRYRIGLFVKDSTAGVGTLTFYEPGSKTYGALGHIIADFDSSSSNSAVEGKIVEAMIKGLHPGKKGQPGEKMGVFKGKSDIIGNIEKNTECGIFGKLEKAVTNPYYNKPIPVAMRYQIEQGPAEILTVLDKNKIEKFNIQILDIFPTGKQGKGMVIKVTDKELIRRTGGIIQGMSGSPIIQNGRLAGAVTHVFINDPTRGYGVLAENMLKQVNLLNEKNIQSKAG